MSLVRCIIFKAIISHLVAQQIIFLIFNMRVIIYFFKYVKSRKLVIWSSFFKSSTFLVMSFRKTILIK